MKRALPFSPNAKLESRVDARQGASLHASTGIAGRLLELSVARIRGLHTQACAYLRGRAAARRERLFDYQRDAREGFLSCATDGGDLERRQRCWERHETNDARAWGSV